MNRQRTIFLVGLVSLGLGAFLLAKHFYQKNQRSEASAQVQAGATALSRSGAFVIGRAAAPVKIVEFLDPECEACAAFYPFSKAILSEFGEKVSLEVRYAPFHGNSRRAIRMLEAARLQNKYLEVLEVMFQTQHVWASHHDPKFDELWGLIPRTGVDVERLRRDMELPEFETLIEQDLRDGLALGVRRTPSFFVNGEPLLEFGPVPLRSLVLKHLSQEK